MRSDSKGKPPGLKSHAVGLGSSSLQDTTEVLESFSVSPTGLEEAGDGEVLENLPGQDELGGLRLLMSQLSLEPCPVGDLAAQFAALALENCQPFPGDDQPPSQGRFWLYNIGDGRHHIADAETPLAFNDIEQCTVPSECLQDPKFQIGAYWAQKCLAELGQTDEDLLRQEPFAVELGDAPLAMTLIKLEEMEQEEGGGMGMGPSFSVRNCVNSKYRFLHRASGVSMELDRRSLLDASFDLRAWRRNLLRGNC
ncbi:unnamed protein product [Mycena citricolor]|uniref:Uncharacterized protein n=1 Tax=Mycena citricolor TaxID=2018698 RepID=A0AAD2K8A7_9AGAR|nr:unnamed protein product [Mycena citricolor]